MKVRKPEPAISRVLSSTTIHLGQLSPTASSNLPGSPFGTDGGRKARTPLFGLAPGGVYRAASCYQSRGALLPHLFTLTSKAGGIFSVALSMGSRPPGVTWRPVRRSPDFPPYLRTAIVWPTPALSGRDFTRYRRGKPQARTPGGMEAIRIVPLSAPGYADKAHSFSRRWQPQRPWPHHLRKGADPAAAANDRYR